MTKRVLSIVLVLTMLISVLPIPAAVSAEPAGQTKHTHTDAHACSEQCSGNVTWQAWGVTGGNATSLPTASGHYYLECDITLSAWVELAAGLDITICLNGYNITETASATGNQRVHGKLTISDCTAYYDAEGNYISGTVTGCKQGDGAFMNVRRGGTLVLESGKITGCTATGGGGAVSLQSSDSSKAGGIFHMYGGEITGNTALNGGGVVANNGGSVYIHGGRIYGNTATGNGRAIYISGASSKLVVSGSPYIDHVYFDNASNAGLQVAGLSDHAKITVNTKTAGATIDKVIKLAGTQDTWDCHWVTINSQSVDKTDSGFVFGHSHNGISYTRRLNTMPEGVSLDKMNYYYLTQDIVLPADRAAHVLRTPVTICLNGYTITQQNPAAPVYEITGSLTLEDGWAYTDANGIYQAGGVTLKSGVTSTSNTGSAFYVNGGSLTLNAGKLYGFTGGGADYGSPIYVTNSGHVTVNGGMICENTATKSRGGAIFARGGNVTITGGTICHNAATNNQAGAVALRESSTLTMQGGVIEYNSAKADGGGIYCHNSTANITGGTICNNTSVASGGGIGFGSAAKGTISGLTVTGNSAPNGAGVLVQGSSQVSISDSSIAGNSGKLGGGIYLTGTTDLTLTNTTVTGNTASSKAGGIYWDNKDSQLTVGGSTQITGNTANEKAQNLYMNNASQMLAVTDLTGSQTVGLSNRSGFASQELTADYSAAFFCDDGENVVSFKENKLYISNGHDHCQDGKTDCGHTQEGWTKWTATDSLPAGAGNYFLANDVELTGRWDVSSDIKLCLNGHAVTQTKEDQRILKLSAGTLTITDCQNGGKLTGGTATADGGGIRVEGENAKLVMYNVTLTGNTTTGHGGGLFVVANAQAELYHVIISDNRAEGSTGGGIALRDGGKLTMVGGTVSGNHSKLDGAGLYAHKDTVTTITDTVFSGNLAEGSGGGIGFGNNAKATVTGGKITGNAALNGGGVIVQGTAEVTMDRCTVESNKTTNEKSLGGGGIFVSSELTMKNCTVKANEAPSGGGIYATGATLVLESGMVADNTSAGSGAGIYATEKTQLTVKDVTVSGNRSQAQAGGMLINKESKATLSGVTVENNTSQKDGGGIYAHTAEITIADSQITGNQSVASAGGIGFGGSCIGSLKNTKITGNEAPNGGGMVVQGTSQITAEAVTVQDNTGSLGSGVFVNKGAALTVTGGSKLIGNKAQQRGGAVYANEGATLVLADCTVDTNEAESGGGIYVCDQALVTLQDAPVIRDNVGGNLYLAKDVAITVGKLTDGASVFVTANPGQFSQPCEDMASYFASDSGYRKVAYVDGALHLVSADNYAHSHCICGGSLDGCKHEKAEWNVWEKTDSLPTSGCYYLLSDVVLTGEVSISQDLTLCLNGHTVTAAENKRILSTPKNTQVTINITDCTAHTTKDGGYVAGALTGGVDMAKETGGGAIFTRAGATLNLYGGKITGNKSITAGGAILVAADATFNMYGGEISHNGNVNPDDPIDGGAIYAIAGSQINLFGGTLSENCGEDGGAIFISGGCTFTMQGGKIEKNHASAQGGGVYVYGGTATISGGSIENNTALACAGGIGFGRKAKVEISGGAISGNTSPNGGGVLIQGGATVKLTGGQITKNHSTGVGGGIYVNSSSTLEMTGGTVDGNTSVKNGGGIYAIKATSNLTGGVISGNSAKKDGGGVYASAGTIQLGGDVKVTGNTTTGSGGGVGFTGKCQAIISGGTIEKNKAVNGGGVIIQGKAHLEITGGAVKDNTAESSGGGIYVYQTTLKLSGGTVSGNQAVKGQGGGLLSYKSETFVTGGSFTGNQSKSDGGAIYAKYGTIKLSGMYVANNTTGGSGGGIGASREAKMTVSGGTIEHNKAVNGAGIIIQGQAHLDLYGGTIQNNEAKDTAGGIYIHKSSGNLLGGTFQGNTAKKNGGGGYFWRSTVKMDSVSFKDNRAKSGGGGFYCYWTEADMNNILVSGNHCESSGGGVVFSHLAKFTLKDSVVENNKATIAAGILTQSWSDGTVTGVTVRNNEAYDGWGGGIGQYNVTDVDYIDCDIYENSATNQGGGVYVRSTRGSNTPLAYADFTNVKIHDNVSKLNGGGICIVQQVVYTMTDCQIYKNEAAETGGGLAHRDGANGTIKNLTVTDNTSGGTGAGIWISDSIDINGLTVTGNKTAEGSAVYFAPSGYDGESFVLGQHKLSGNIYVCDNQGTMDDLFIDERTVIGVANEGFGAETKIQVQLAAGILTSTLLGQYDYQGGDLHYTVTAGSRSLTEPEIFVPAEEPESTPTEETDATETTQNAKDAAETADNTMLYAGIGGIVAVIVLAAVAVVLAKKKKTGKTTGATKE